MDIYFLDIAGLSHLKKRGKSVYLAIAVYFSNFFHYVYNALGTFAPKINFLS